MMDYYYWPGAGGFGIGHWVSFIVMLVLVLYPIGRILRRVGFSPYLSVLALVPIVNLIALWLLAFADWPQRGGDAARISW